MKRPTLPLNSKNSKTSYGRQVSPFESPTKKLNKKLLALVAELRKDCDNYREELRAVKEDDVGEIVTLQQENERLNREVYELQSFIDQVRKKIKKQEKKNVLLNRVKALTKENSEMKEDIEVLKSVIRRLNSEISRYQDKLRSDPMLTKSKGKSTYLSREDNNSGKTKSASQDLLQTPRKLFPLLQAYDEIIEDKNDIISCHERELDKFKSKCKDIVRENEELHEIIADKNQTGSVSIAEWQALRANSLLVLEENDILHEQLSILKDKSDTMSMKYQEKVSVLDSKISKLENEKSLLKSASLKTENHCKLLIEQHSKLAEILDKRIPIEHHEASVMECKKHFEDLKISYNEERSVLMDKLSSVEKERDRLVNELTELEVQNGKLQSNLNICEEALNGKLSQLKDAFRQVSETNNAKEATTAAMEDMMVLSQRVVQERESLERVLEEQRNVNEQLLNMRETEGVLVNTLQGKLQEMDKVHNQELENFARRIRELETLLEEADTRYYNDYRRFEELLDTKSRVVEQLEAEKRQLQSDIETVWKTTTATIKDIGGSKTALQMRTNLASSTSVQNS